MSARISKAEALAAEVADLRHDLEMLKTLLSEREDEMKVAFAKAGVTKVVTSDGEMVAVVASPTTSVDAEALKGLISLRLFNQLRSDSLAMPKYHSAKKMGRITPEVAAAVEVITDRTMIRVHAAKVTPVTPAPKVVRSKMKAKAGSK